MFNSDSDLNLLCGLAAAILMVTLSASCLMSNNSPNRTAGFEIIKIGFPR